MTSKAILKAIEAKDPDGWVRQPSPADYFRHQDWAVATFGTAAWYDYHTPGWDR